MSASSGIREDAVARDDHRLIERLATGDADALADLYDRYSERAFRVARSVCRDEGRAQDAVQEAFLSAWHTSEFYRPALGTVASWLLGAVRHRAVDVARRNGRHAGQRADLHSLDTERAPTDVAAEAVTKAHAQHLQVLLARLPEAQREVIVLAYYGELSNAEIADHLELPLGTVKGRMRLGLQKLRADADQAVT